MSKQDQLISYILQIITVCQAVWVLTILGFLMWHYVWRSIKNRFLEKNAIAMGVSYCFITVCTMLTSFKQLYTWDDVWQILAIIGYAFGDYAIVKMLYHVTRNERAKKIIRDHIARESEKQKQH